MNDRIEMMEQRIEALEAELKAYKDGTGELNVATIELKHKEVHDEQVVIKCTTITPTGISVSNLYPDYGGHPLGEASPVYGGPEIALRTHGLYWSTGDIFGEHWHFGLWANMDGEFPDLRLFVNGRCASPKDFVIARMAPRPEFLLKTWEDDEATPNDTVEKPQRCSADLATAEQRWIDYWGLVPLKEFDGKCVRCGQSTNDFVVCSTEIQQCQWIGVCMKCGYGLSSSRPNSENIQDWDAPPEDESQQWHYCRMPF